MFGSSWELLPFWTQIRLWKIRLRGGRLLIQQFLVELFDCVWTMFYHNSILAPLFNHILKRRGHFICFYTFRSGSVLKQIALFKPCEVIQLEKGLLVFILGIFVISGSSARNWDFLWKDLRLICVQLTHRLLLFHSVCCCYGHCLESISSILLHFLGFGKLIPFTRWFTLFKSWFFRRLLVVWNWVKFCNFFGGFKIRSIHLSSYLWLGKVGWILIVAILLHLKAFLCFWRLQFCLSESFRLAVVIF